MELRRGVPFNCSSRRASTSSSASASASASSPTKRLFSSTVGSSGAAVSVYSLRGTTALGGRLPISKTTRYHKRTFNNILCFRLSTASLRRCVGRIFTILRSSCIGLFDLLGFCALTTRCATRRWRGSCRGFAWRRCRVCLGHFDGNAAICKPGALPLTMPSDRLVVDGGAASVGESCLERD